MDNKFTVLHPSERKRTYIFTNGEVSFEGVAAILIRPSGTHRLELLDGTKVIVPAGWLAIKLDVDAWTL